MQRFCWSALTPQYRRVGGFVVWDGVSAIDATRRIQEFWKFIRAELTAQELEKSLGLILLFTPREMAYRNEELEYEAHEVQRSVI